MTVNILEHSVTSGVTNPGGLSVGIVGLGYVGLPLAVEFGKKFRTIGFDLSPEKIASYQTHIDPTGEVLSTELRAATQLSFSTSPGSLSVVDVIVVAVPTPVDDANLPDFGPLKSACGSIGPFLKDGAVIVFESTVYPGATEEICIPELEAASGKTWRKHFFVGYSPERINPGDEAHRLKDVVKVVAGDSPRTLNLLAQLYGSIVSAGIHCASSIKVAEAAKVIENTQRDLNIALMNELAVIFDRLGLDTTEVLQAAGTKWNFIRFKPGLVGGHCIGVDPYYLTYAAQRAGHHPEVILAGRRINDFMGKYVAQQAVKCLSRRGYPITGCSVNVLGLSFKENCPDTRNSKVVDIIQELAEFGATSHVHDPRVLPEDALTEHGIQLRTWGELRPAHAIVLAVAHDEYRRIALDELLSKVKPGGCVIDVKGILDRHDVEKRGYLIWRL